MWDFNNILKFNGILIFNSFFGLKIIFIIIKWKGKIFFIICFYNVWLLFFLVFNYFMVNKGEGVFFKIFVCGFGFEFILLIVLFNLKKEKYNYILKVVLKLFY